MEKQNYSFQNDKDRKFHKTIETQISVFKTNIGLNGGTELGEDSEKLIYVFCYENIMNIIWYQKGIKKEQFLRRFYFILSLFLLIALPVTISILSIKQPFQSDGTMGAIEKITSFITIIIALVLAMQKFIGAWVESRKFMGQFYSAFTDLRNILFRLENDWTYNDKFETGQDKNFSKEFKQALDDAITNSRDIVTKETKKYFDLLTIPKIDIGNILTSSSSSSKSILKALSNIDVDTVKDQIKTDEENFDEKSRITVKYKEQIKFFESEFEQYSERYNELCEKTELSDIENLEKIQLLEDLKTVKENIRKLKLELIEKEAELKSLN